MEKCSHFIYTGRRDGKGLYSTVVGSWMTLGTLLNFPEPQFPLI